MAIYVRICDTVKWVKTNRPCPLQVPQKYNSIDANGSEGISFSSKFSTISVDLDDYPKAENPSLTLQMVSLVDLNADGKKDIVAHYWHNIWDAGSDYYESVPNKVIAFLQDDDQIFVNSNIEVFGEENVDLFGGASRKQTLGDFNYDGYIDIAYAMNREDGRPGVYSRHTKLGILSCSIIV